MKNKFLLAMVFAASLAGCSNPKNEIVPTDVSKMESIKPAIEKLSADEKQLLVAFIMRHSMSVAAKGLFGIKPDPIPEGMTIGKAIEEQAEFIAKQKAKEAEEAALKAKLKAERDQAVATMRDAILVTVISKKSKIESGYSGMVMDEFLSVTFGYQNNSGKDIAGVKGTVDIEDLFGDHLVGFNISNDTTIKAGGTSTWTGGRSLKYGMSKDNDRKFLELPDDKYKVVWKPEMVVFSDGTKLTAPRD